MSYRGNLDLTDLPEGAIKAVEADCSPVDTEQRYREALEEMYPDEEINGTTYRALCRIDTTDESTDFRCGHVDWLDGEYRDNRLVEVNGENYDYDEVAAAVEAWEDEQAEKEEDEDEEEDTGCDDCGALDSKGCICDDLNHDVYPVRTK